VANRNIIVIGASSGGLEPIKTLVAGLPSGIPCAIFIVWHLSPDVKGVLPHILQKVNTIPAAHARDGETLEMGRIYVAPPDHHLLVDECNRVHVTRGPRENRFRPAIDPLFRSAAFAFGNRVIGVILSGALDDGVAGLWTIKQRGGITIVQSPEEAAAASMPREALSRVKVDHVAASEEIARLLSELAGTPVSNKRETGADDGSCTALEIDVAREKNTGMAGFDFGSLSPFTCPECEGVLTALIEGGRARYRCHRGHAFSAETLLGAVSEKVEENLWSSVQAMREYAALLNHMGDHFAEASQPRVASRYFMTARDTALNAEKLRHIITGKPEAVTDQASLKLRDKARQK
jgi:two-component system chemotaxis response regulator CheB